MTHDRDDDDEIDDEYEDELEAIRDGLFGFFAEDREAMIDLADLIRSTLSRPDANPRDIFHLSKLLFAVQRFPLPTKGVEIDLTVRVRFENGEMSSQTLLLDGDAFRVGKADYIVSDPDTGGDGSSETYFEAEVGGFRDTAHPLALMDWIEEFRERLNDPEQVLEISDDGNSSELDWSAELGDAYWEKLDSEYL